MRKPKPVQKAVAILSRCKPWMACVALAVLLIVAAWCGVEWLQSGNVAPQILPGTLP